MSVKEAGEGKIIWYLDGLCYGITPDGQTVCLGKEADIKEMLANSNKRSDNSLVNEIVDLELELREEVKDGIRTEVRKGFAQKRHSSIKRGRPVRGTKSQGGNTKLSAPRKRLSIR